MTGAPDLAGTPGEKPPGSSIHVLRLTPHFYWPQLEKTGWPVKFDAIGGMQTQIYDQTCALAKAGLSQTVVTLKIPGAPARWDMDARTIVRGVRVPVLPIRSRVRGMMDLNLSWLLGVLSVLPGVLPSVDIVHVHWSGVGIPPLLSWMLAKWSGAPVVVTVHCSSLATYHPMSLLDIPRNNVAQMIERSALKAVRQAVVLTPRIAEMLGRDLPAMAERISVIPDAIDRNQFASPISAQSTEDFKTAHGLPKDRPIVGYVGRVAREKGWRTFVDVIAGIGTEDVHFLVCGDGNERDLLERELDRRGLRAGVTVTGYLPHADVAYAISACDVLLLTSQHEEFGSVLLEAMAVGVPAVAFDVGGIPHVLDRGDAGAIVPAGDVVAMVKAVRELLASETLRARIRDGGYRQLATKFGREAATAKTIELYRAVKNGRPAGGRT